MDKDIRNAFLDISRILALGKSGTLHNHSFSTGVTNLFAIAGHFVSYR